MRKSLLLLAVLGTLASSQVVMAAEAAETPTWTFPASASLVSDYIWRGQTQTWGNPAVQFGIEADHVSGAYAGFWASNVSSHWLPNANLEMDFSAGFRNTFATDFKYDVGGTYIYYPDGDFAKVPPATGTYTKSKLNTLELYASLGWQWFTVKGGYMPTKFYGWNVNNSGYPSAFPNNPSAVVTGDTNGSYYYMGSVSYDLPMALNISGEIGRQTIASSTGLDWTWYKVGVTKTFDGALTGWALNAFYTGTSGSDAYKNYASFDNLADTTTIDKSKVVVGITKSF